MLHLFDIGTCVVNRITFIGPSKGHPEYGSNNNSNEPYSPRALQRWLRFDPT